MYYNARIARNWKQFRGIYVQQAEVVTRIKTDMKIRLELFSASKRAHNCRDFMYRLNS